jgi:hypothetical protein
MNSREIRLVVVLVDELKSWWHFDPNVLRLAALLSGSRKAAVTHQNVPPLKSLSILI